MDPNLKDSPSEPSGAFPPTRWSVVLDAGNEDPAALASFCSTYWFPLYSFARRAGRSVEDAEDLTQAFFERILSREFLRQVRSERGRLRSFLLRAFNNFAVDEWKRGASRKRGGGRPLIEIDAMTAEQRLAVEPQTHRSPEREYERAWARELLRQALERLEITYQSSGHGTLFLTLRDHLVGDSTDQSYRDLASILGLTEASARFAAFKLRQRYRATLQEVVAETVASPAEVDAELAHLETLFQD